MLHYETFRELVFTRCVNHFKQIKQLVTDVVTFVNFFNFLTLIVHFITILWVKRFHFECNLVKQ